MVGWQAGDVVAGKYRVERVIGAGGMGVVVAARHLRLDEQVAIKLLLPGMAERPDMVQRFVREARAASKIKSEHVVRVLDADVLPSGAPYLVMEYLEGKDLGAVLRERGTLPVEEAVGYALQTCEPIAEAHAIGIVHRDLKPGNLFLARRRDGSTHVKVLDFGISKVTSGGAFDGLITQAQVMLGSPLYMSPEQIRSTHAVDGRSDIWGLGVILFEMLTGQTPFSGETLDQVCAAVLHGDPPRPSALRPDVPPGLEAVILRCLQRDPARRFASMAELAAALAPFAPASAGAGHRAIAGAAIAPIVPIAPIVAVEPAAPGAGAGPIAPIVSAGPAPAAAMGARNEPITPIAPATAAPPAERNEPITPIAPRGVPRETVGGRRRSGSEHTPATGYHIPAGVVAPRRRGRAAALVLLALMGATVAGGWLLWPRLRTWVQPPARIAARLPPLPPLPSMQVPPPEPPPAPQPEPQPKPPEMSTPDTAIVPPAPSPSLTAPATPRTTPPVSTPPVSTPLRPTSKRPRAPEPPDAGPGPTPQPDPDPFGRRRH